MRRLCAALAVLSCVAVAPARAADFSSWAVQHAPGWSPEGGRADRSLLVVYVAFADFAYPASPDVPGLQRRAFGGFPSIADYWASQSSGALTLTPARESDASGGGGADDGIVRVRLAMTRDAFAAQPDVRQNRLALEAADAAVDFASFDRDGNGSVSTEELVTLRVDASATPLPDGAAETRGVEPVSLDGRELGGLRVAQVTTGTNLVSMLHETWHALFGTRDFYGFGVGWLDISAATIGIPDDRTVALAAWNKLGLGWTTGTVVTRDGYHVVPDAGRESFVLHDPQRGTDDFFVVENRRARAGTYDNGAADDGLVVWRLDRRVYASLDDGVRPVELMRPDGAPAPGCRDGCYGGSATDAFDAGDPRTPQRSMTRAWRDGAPANVAVRAIGRAGQAMRVYFDVRGPGVLVDPYALDVTGPVGLTAGAAREIAVPVMNTGEAADTVDVALAGLPPGWMATAAAMRLGPGAEGSAGLTVTPPAEARGPVTLEVLGVSRSDPSVRTTAPVTFTVSPAGAGPRGTAPPPSPRLTLRLRATVRQRVLRRNQILVRGTCSALCELRARTTISVRRRGRLVGRFDGGRTARTAPKAVGVPLSRAARRRVRRALRAGRVVEARVIVDAIGDSGGRARDAVSVRITG